MNIIPYVGFNGNAAEAIEFYAKVLSGETEIMLVKDAPTKPEGMTENLVFHSAVKVNGGVVLMASDMMMGDVFERGNSISLTLNPTDETQATSYFNGLSEGGEIIFPLSKSEWGSLFGQLRDKYDIVWMIDCTL